jgi:hypothetical protein
VIDSLAITILSPSIFRPFLDELRAGCVALDLYPAGECSKTLHPSS